MANENVKKCHLVEYHLIDNVLSDRHFISIEWLIFNMFKQQTTFKL